MQIVSRIGQNGLCYWCTFCLFWHFSFHRNGQFRWIEYSEIGGFQIEEFVHVGLLITRSPCEVHRVHLIRNRWQISLERWLFD